MAKLFFLLFFVMTTTLMAKEPLAVYLTCQDAPHAAMTVQWITPLQEEKGTIQYKLSDASTWQLAESSFLPLPNKTSFGVHRIELTELQPDSEYLFKIGEEEKVYKFLTLPSKLNKPLTFISGGDIYCGKNKLPYIEMNRRAAAQSPSFVLWGGDLAYASHNYFLNLEKAERWLDLLAIWSKTMITPSGHLIPLITAIGNHEVTGRYNQTPAQAPFFYALFPTKGYQAVDVGDYLSVIVLDSGHTHPIEGEQTEWLRSILAERKKVPFKFATYHVPAFPCVRSYKNKYSAKVRKFWPALFETFRVQAAFEHHDHAYKRSHPLHGVLYFGDGGWGVDNMRKPRSPKKAWYLAKTDGQRHFLRVTINPNKKVQYQAINAAGTIFDEYVQDAS